MVNAWSLLYSEINGTMDEDYPIMNKKEDITILGGDGNDTISLKSSEDIPEDYITFTGFNSSVAAADTISLDSTWWAEDGFSVTGNPAGSSQDTLNLGPTRLPGGMGEDHISISGYAGTQYNDNKYYADGYDPYPIVGGGNTASAEYGFPPKPQPDLTSERTQKYGEDKGIADLKDYVSSTYSGHYTSKNNSVQTLDLIQSVGDAESFCRSNAIKYLSRYDKKGQAKRDILKAMHYCLLLYYFSGNTNNETPTRGYETF